MTWPLRLESPQPPDPATPAQDARGSQMERALGRLERDESKFLRIPYQDLDAIVQGIGEGSLWFLAGQSGIAGKTTFLTSLALEWFKRWVRVYYLSLETPDDELWLRIACQEAGISYGRLATGGLHTDPEWPAMEASLNTIITRWKTLPEAHMNLWVHPAERADVSVIAEAAHEAEMLGADVMIIDHIDHLHGDPSRGDYGMSVDVTRRVDQIRKDNPHIRLLVATQLNTDAIRGDALAKVLPPLEGHIKMGAHKREVSDGMLGLYRPLKAGVTGDQLKAVRNRELDPLTLVEPGQMGVNIMKHRALGEMLDRKCVLGVDAVGRVRHLPERDRYATGYDEMRRI